MQVAKGHDGPELTDALQDAVVDLFLSFFVQVILEGPIFLQSFSDHLDSSQIIMGFLQKNDLNDRVDPILLVHAEGIIESDLDFTNAG